QRCSIELASCRAVSGTARDDRRNEPLGSDGQARRAQSPARPVRRRCEVAVMRGLSDGSVELAAGAFHLRRHFSSDGERVLVRPGGGLVEGPVPAYVPTVRGGGKMHVQMLCLGRHWNGRTYRYELVRTDFDGLPAPPLPDDFRALAIE